MAISAALPKSQKKVPRGNEALYGPNKGLACGDTEDDYRLTVEGYAVDHAQDGLKGEQQALSGNYDVIILDVMLPSKDGFQICQTLRANGINSPILMLTARSTNIDTVMGLKLGADDYLTKPFDMGILLARLEALSRRVQ